MVISITTQGQTFTPMTSNVYMSSLIKLRWVDCYRLFIIGYPSRHKPGWKLLNLFELCLGHRWYKPNLYGHARSFISGWCKWEVCALCPFPWCSKDCTLHPWPLCLFIPGEPSQLPGEHIGALPVGTTTLVPQCGLPWHLLFILVKWTRPSWSVHSCTVMVASPQQVTHLFHVWCLF